MIHRCAQDDCRKERHKHIMNTLDQLKQFTTVVADTGDFNAMRAYAPRDATTNPSLILKAVQQDAYKPLFSETVAANRSLAVGEIVDRVLIRFGLEIGRASCRERVSLVV